MTHSTCIREEVRVYWVAIKPADGIPANVFGPYSLADAVQYRNDLLKTYPSTAKISDGFKAETREQAERQAGKHFHS